MRRHLDIDQLLGHRRKVHLFAALFLLDAGKHHFRNGVFVIDAEQPAIRADRHEADIIVVVAELLRLRRGGLLLRIEIRRAGDDRIAPAQQHIGAMSAGDVVRLVNPVRDLRRS